MSCLIVCCSWSVAMRCLHFPRMFGSTSVMTKSVHRATMSNISWNQVHLTSMGER